MTWLLGRGWGGISPCPRLGLSPSFPLPASGKGLPSPQLWSLRVKPPPLEAAGGIPLLGEDQTPPPSSSHLLGPQGRQPPGPNQNAPLTQHHQEDLLHPGTAVTLLCSTLFQQLLLEIRLKPNSSPGPTRPHPAAASRTAVPNFLAPGPLS